MQKSENKYEVSVIIPTYNNSQLIKYTLTALCKQDLSKDRFEVIVADDGSSDDTEKMVNTFRERLNLKYVFQEDKGYRPGSARNKGILLSEGEICIFIDSTVIMNTNCVSEHIYFYRNIGHKAAAIGYVYGFDQTKESETLLKELVIPDDPAESVKRLSAYRIFQDVREEHYATHNHMIHLLPAPWAFFWTCHVSARREDLIHIDLFDENYDGKWGMEDFDLAFRLHRSGVSIHLLKPAEAIHYPHKKDMLERKRQGFQNCIYFHNKFRTFETGVYLDNYHNIEFVDLNELSMKLRPLAACADTVDGHRG